MTRMASRIWTIGWTLVALGLFVALSGCQMPTEPKPIAPACWNTVDAWGWWGCVQP